MRFVYEYRTRDNSIHNGVISATNRESAFAKLRAQGIKPARLGEAPGFFNKLFGRGKRWLAIAALALTAVYFAVLWCGERSLNVSGGAVAPRHQIYGDPAIMAEMERSSYESVFPGAAERYLAVFAQPGELSRQISFAFRDDMVSALSVSEHKEVSICDGDGREQRELKQIVNGMNAELRRYLANGNGTVESYVRRLFERQAREIRIYKSIERELAGQGDPSLYSLKNAELRAVGLRSIPFPEQR